jgi:hypothetical protein
MMLAGVDPSCCTTKPLSDDHADNPVHKINGMGADCGEVTMGGEVKMGGGMAMPPPTMGSPVKMGG